MTKFAIAFLFAGAAAAASAQGTHYVQPHYTQNGTYVEGHMQTNPDGNVYNNWSTQGNVNPYTGQPGTVNPYSQGYAQPQVPHYQQYQQPVQQPVCRMNSYGQMICR